MPAGKEQSSQKRPATPMIGFVVLGYAIHGRKKKPRGVTNKADSSGNKFRNFFLGLPAPHIAIANSTTSLTRSNSQALANLLRWAFILTFAGVGRRTNIGERRKNKHAPPS